MGLKAKLMFPESVEMSHGLSLSVLRDTFTWCAYPEVKALLWQTLTNTSNNNEGSMLTNNNEDPNNNKDEQPGCSTSGNVCTNAREDSKSIDSSSSSKKGPTKRKESPSPESDSSSSVVNDKAKSAKRPRRGVDVGTDNLGDVLQKREDAAERRHKERIETMNSLVEVMTRWLIKSNSKDTYTHNIIFSL
ncbi:unnamed protein product [Mytilus coruscus]|uniref:Uncharacterized protein n=1 Tax=Mytilus coruscus TaxID=42192 RepID=A0A6J8A931_MYTCO|nr:unnamed protein product [Mytilus coruscus]